MNVIVHPLLFGTMALGVHGNEPKFLVICMSITVTTSQKVKHSLAIQFSQFADYLTGGLSEQVGLQVSFFGVLLASGAGARLADIWSGLSVHYGRRGPCPAAPPSPQRHVKTLAVRLDSSGAHT